jgi:LuxR family maltose regulon positive regulatory protein
VATAPLPAIASLTDDLALKVTAPRVPRDLVARQRLLSSADLLRDRQVIVVQAPPGFGKTSLLAQWRREHLAHGVVVPWLLAQARDEPQRFVESLVVAVRVGAGRPNFGHTLLQPSAPSGLEAITVWLAELAKSALEIVLIIDEADRLPADSRDLLAYVLHNAPANLRLVISARADPNLGVEDLSNYGQCLVIGASLLRFQLDETIQLIRSRFGNRIDNDAVARLHELTEGWPLGLQLALSFMATGKDAAGAIAAIARQGGELSERLVGLMLANLSPGDAEFLARISILDHLHPDLCRATTTVVDAEVRLARLERNTPLFIAAEDGDWARMHSLARHALRRRFAALPAEEQAASHMRAAAWLDARGLLEAAAGHAWSAGQRERAFELAERSVYEAFRTQGRQGTVFAWLARLPDDELDRRPRLLLAAAWSLALSERHPEAQGFVERLLARPGADDALRCECAMISSGAAVYADDPDRFAALHDPWSEAPPLEDPILLQVHANRSALRALLGGDPGLARLRVQRGPHRGAGEALSYVSRWSELLIGLSYLWEGQVLLAENLLQPTLAAAEGELGRRSPLTSMLAVLLAAAQWERDQPLDAIALLADRLDVLEHAGLPEILMLAYRTLARIAIAENAEHRAMELLQEMHAIGVARRLPRLCIASLVEQLRMHARRYRAETCRDLSLKIDAMLADDSVSHGPLWRRSVDAWREFAHGHAAMAERNWRGALEPLRRAEEAARGMHLGRLGIEIKGLRALALDRLGETSRPLLLEAADLARANGLVRVLPDAHPDLAEWLRDVAGNEQGQAGARSAPSGSVKTLERHGPSTPTPSMALTPKEREVLELLARSLTNKEIALALDVGEQTIKWHVKNLLAKLDAGTRKQVVQRARILGLLQAAA